MQGIYPRLSGTPGQVRFAGTGLGAANEEIYGKLGYSEEELKALKEQNII